MIVSLNLIWLYPTKTVYAKEVINRLSEQQKTFGNPEQIISNKESAFTSEKFLNFCTEEGIEHIHNMTGIPRRNGQVEKMIETIIPILTKLLNNSERWYKNVDRMQQYINNTNEG